MTASTDKFGSHPKGARRLDRLIRMAAPRRPPPRQSKSFQTNENLRRRSKLVVFLAARGAKRQHQEGRQRPVFVDVCQAGCRQFGTHCRITLSGAISAAEREKQQQARSQPQ